MTDLAQEPKFVSTDSRGRLSVGRPDSFFLMHEDADGRIVLEPAVVMTELEERYLRNAALQVEVEYAKAHPEQRVGRSARRSRS